MNRRKCFVETPLIQSFHQAGEFFKKQFKRKTVVELSVKLWDQKVAREICFSINFQIIPSSSSLLPFLNGTRKEIKCFKSLVNER